MLRGPEISPVSAIRCGQPVILQDNGDEEPEDDFPAEKGTIKGGNLARLLAVVIWKTEEEHKGDDPQEDGDRSSDAGDGRAGGEKDGR